MGAWGPASFENDDALDWVVDLGQSDDWTVVVAAFAAIPEDREVYVESDEACHALAAGEVVAAVLGKPSASLPEEVQVWLEGRTVPDPDLIGEARRAVRRVFERSEVRDLWEEGNTLDTWTMSVKNLLERLTYQ